jgi:hypothetical protein
MPRPVRDQSPANFNATRTEIAQWPSLAESPKGEQCDMRSNRKRPQKDRQRLCAGIKSKAVLGAVVPILSFGHVNPWNNAKLSCYIEVPRPFLT